MVKQDVTVYTGILLIKWNSKVDDYCNFVIHSCCLTCVCVSFHAFIMMPCSGATVHSGPLSPPCRLWEVQLKFLFICEEHFLFLHRQKTPPTQQQHQTWTQQQQPDRSPAPDQVLDQRSSWTIRPLEEDPPIPGRPWLVQQELMEPQRLAKNKCYNRKAFCTKSWASKDPNGKSKLKAEDWGSWEKRNSSARWSCFGVSASSSWESWINLGKIGWNNLVFIDWFGNSTFVYSQNTKRPKT